MIVNDIAMIAADTTRSRVYIQSLSRNNILPNFVLLLGNKHISALPGEINNSDTENNHEMNIIDEDWDEVDFNKLEEENHIRMAFRLALRRLMENGSIDRATAEYMESNGIHPMSGERVTRQYHQEVTQLLDEGKAPSVKHFHNFLDNMVEMFKGSHKDTMDRIGIKDIIKEKSVLLTHDHKDLDYFLENHGFQKAEEKLISDK